MEQKIKATGILLSILQNKLYLLCVFSIGNRPRCEKHKSIFQNYIEIKNVFH